MIQIVFQMKELFSMMVQVIDEFPLKMGDAFDNILHGGPSLRYLLDFCGDLHCQV
jgi:hypothetical protein